MWTKELGERIGLDPKAFQDWPDSRLLLHAWEHLGDAVWPCLRGVFAAAIFDPRSRTLRLARDPLGLNVVMLHRNVTNAFEHLSVGR